MLKKSGQIHLEKGLVHVYTGHGKGKTSAAFGLALRAIARDLKVYIIQFIKGGFDYGELYIAPKLKNLKLKAFGRGDFVKVVPPSEIDIQLAEEALNLARKIILSGKYDVVILDEINVATHLGLIKVEDVVNLIRNKPAHVELVLTGRYAAPEVITLADYVTEMKEIKHPYQKGAQPRKGIEY
jgi:cob(I)alamin adenosyltransferase